MTDNELLTIKKTTSEELSIALVYSRLWWKFYHLRLLNHSGEQFAMREIQNMYDHNLLYIR